MNTELKAWINFKIDNTDAYNRMVLNNEFEKSLVDKIESYFNELHWNHVQYWIELKFTDQVKYEKVSTLFSKNMLNQVESIYLKQFPYRHYTDYDWLKVLKEDSKLYDKLVMNFTIPSYMAYNVGLMYDDE
jgi:hypothetical protein